MHEKKILYDYISSNFYEVMLEGKMYVLEGKRRELFLLSDEIYKYIKKIERHPFCVGLYLGEIKGRKCTPSLQLIVNFGKFAKKKIYVKEKGEILFTMGRDILEESLLKEVGNPKEGEEVFVLNERNECLGIARKEKGIYKNVLDIGWYIRHGE